MATGTKPTERTQTPMIQGMGMETISEPTGFGEIALRNLHVYYGKFLAVRNANLTVKANNIMALIGPSGSGKSSLLRAINRIHETAIGAYITGQVTLDGIDLYKSDVGDVRRTIGMVFQRPNPLNTKSIFDNAAMGLLIGGEKRGPKLQEKVELALRRAAIWEEVKDKLGQPGTSLSGGQQQRLCIARALAVEPDVLLMDEPASALDPVSTLKIEDLMQQLKSTLTIIIVTHNMQQAARVSDYTAVMTMMPDKAGELIEVGPTQQIFTSPKEKQTEEYITGRVG